MNERRCTGCCCQGGEASRHVLLHAASIATHACWSPGVAPPCAAFPCNLVRRHQSLGVFIAQRIDDEHAHVGSHLHHYLTQVWTCECKVAQRDRSMRVRRCLATLCCKCTAILTARARLACRGGARGVGERRGGGGGGPALWSPRVRPPPTAGAATTARLRLPVSLIYKPLWMATVLLTRCPCPSVASNALAMRTC